ncbi:DUF5801 repeats-in-toxin domain-containing protein [Desulfomicrobium baculatum]|uniref:Hemolysin-type calcium-binding region n=1 Tax=Desulfomicrobium baculatum (strain DSM 4028 / VKM B-1378 / X) TaxID=525897 RepID=C7LRT2_DESBD|nr:DUF5801 repeats-in-toxin domain-containing protein [Desulfomicrobium baculatum]ACU88138.1 Hemolysin-type calcium-binding region [Desulfomicrobium baculatum DSM 4028]
MAETQNSKQNVQAPQAGQTVVVNAIPGQDIVLEAAFDQAEVKMDGGNVVFEFANGGQVVLDFTDLGEAQAPNVVMPDGTILNMQEFLASLGEKDIEPAAGPEGGADGSGGVGEYQDDAGDLLGGVDKLGVLGPRAFSAFSVEALEANGSIPTLLGGESVLVEDEKMLPEGNDEDDGGVGSVTGTIVDNVDWGADGFGEVTGFNVGGASFSAGSTVFWGQDGTFLGTSGEGAAASLVVGADGFYTFTLLDNMLLGEGVQGEQINVLGTVQIVGADTTGDEVEIPLTLNVQDDVPEIVGEMNSDTAIVEDEATRGGINEWWDGLKGKFEGTIEDNVKWGADEFRGVTEFSIGEQVFTVEAGESTTVYWDQHGKLLSLGDEPSNGPEMSFASFGKGYDGEFRPAASLEVKSDGTYIFRLHDNMLLGVGEKGEQIDDLATVMITGLDNDGDAVQVGVNLQVQDDVPLCLTWPDYAIVEDEKMEGGNNEPGSWFFPDLPSQVDGTIEDNAAWGADGFGRATTFEIDGYSFAVGTTVFWNQHGNLILPEGMEGEDQVQFRGAVSISEVSEEPEGAAASLIVNGNGSYTFTLIDNMLMDGKGEQYDLLDRVKVNAEDGDGDKVSVYVNLIVKDDKPVLDEDGVLRLTLEEESVPGDDGVIGNNEPGDGLSYTSGEQSMRGAVKWGADDFGKVVQLQFGSGRGVVRIDVDQEDGGIVYFDADGNPQSTSVGSAAILEVQADGQYTLTVTGAMNHLLQGEDRLPLGAVKIIAQDGDGDKISVRLEAEVQDDVPVITVTDPTPVPGITVQLVGSDAGYNNTWGYYIKAENGEPDTGVVVWDSVKNQPVTSVTLPEGVLPGQVGFFLIPNGDSLNQNLTSGTEVTFSLVNGQWVVSAQGVPLNGVGAPALFDNSALNADGKSYINTVATGSVTGNQNWEDVYGGGDGDFNDVMLNVTMPLLVDDSFLNVDATSDVGRARFSVDYGADGAAELESKVYNLTLEKNESGLEDTALKSNGENAAVLLKTDGSTKVIGYVLVNGVETPVFTLSVNAATGEVTLDQHRAVVHPTAGDSNEIIRVLDGAILLELTAKDGDGDLVSASLDIGRMLYIADDGPVANDDADTAVWQVDRLEASGNVLTGVGTASEDAGKDLHEGMTDGAAAAVVGVRSGAEGETWVEGEDIASGGSATVSGSYGTLTMESDGDYTYAGKVTNLVLNADDNTEAFNFGTSYSENLGEELHLDNADGTIVSVANGLGVAGKTPDTSNSVSDQLGFSPKEGSEALSVNLETMAVRAVVDISNLYQNESGQSGNNGETGRWEAFDAEGFKVGEGYIGGELFDNVNVHQGQVEVEVMGADGKPIAFQYIVFSAVDYLGGDKANDSSDYYVKAVSFEEYVKPGSEDEFSYQMKDGDGDTDSATLTITTGHDLSSGDIGVVHEDALSSGNLDNSSQGLTTSGSLNMGAGEYSLVAPVQKITSDGHNVEFVVDNTGEESIMFGRVADGDSFRNILQVTMDKGDGSYTVTLLGQVDHQYAVETSGNPDGSGAGETEMLYLQFVAAKTAEGTTEYQGFNIKIEDDAPVILASPNLVTNGSFENPDVTGWGTYGNIPGWKAEAGQIEIQDSGAGGVAAQHGGQLLELDAHGGTATNATVTQSIPTANYGNLVLSFWFASRAYGDIAETNTVKVYWGDVEIGEITDSVAGRWTQHSFNVAGNPDGSDVELRFVGAGTDDSYGGLIDNVSVYSMPSVDEEGLHVATPVFTTASLPVLFGADGPGDIVVDLDVVGLKSNGDQVSTAWDPSSHILTGTAGGRTVFTLEVDLDTGKYTFSLNDQLDHAATSDFMALDFTFTATDGDGDFVDGTFAVGVFDDEPTAHADFDGVTSVPNSTAAPLAVGNVLDNDSIGADEDATVTHVSFAGNTFAVDSDGVSVKGNYGTLFMEQDGSYEYVLNGETVITNGLNENLVSIYGATTLQIFESNNGVLSLDVSEIQPGGYAWTGGEKKAGWGVTQKMPATIDSGESLVFKFVEPVTTQTFTFSLGQNNAGQATIPNWYAFSSTGSLLGSGNFADPNNSGELIPDLKVSISGEVSYIVFSHQSATNSQGFVISGISYGEGDTGIDQFEYTMQDFDGDVSSASLYITSDEYREGDAGSNSLYGHEGDDILLGLGGTDTLMGNDGNDVLHGGDGDDFLNGNKGEDQLYGDAGNDTIHGGMDDDVIYGGSGDDLIYGDKGDDTMSGGEGRDVFKYAGDALENTTNGDVILDFDYDKDQLDLSDLLNGKDADGLGDYLKIESFESIDSTTAKVVIQVDADGSDNDSDFSTTLATITMNNLDPSIDDTNILNAMLADGALKIV